MLIAIIDNLPTAECCLQLKPYNAIDVDHKRHPSIGSQGFTVLCEVYTEMLSLDLSRYRASIGWNG